LVLTIPNCYTILLWEFQFSSILYTCPNQRNLCGHMTTLNLLNIASKFQIFAILIRYINCTSCVYVDTLKCAYRLQNTKNVIHHYITCIIANIKQLHVLAR
jgi:hypothetical protein